MSDSKFKDDLVLKAVLGPDTYERVKKYVAAWKADYLNEVNIHSSISLTDYIKTKISEHERSENQEWNVYSGEKKLATVRAETQDKAIEKVKMVFPNHVDFSAKRRVVMRT